MTISSDDKSITAWLLRRERGMGRTQSQVRDGYFIFQRKKLLDRPEIVSPHRTAISSLSVDGAHGRFLLAGSADATVSVYDVSRVGSEEHARATRGAPRTFRPIARSVRVPASECELDVPSGHSSSVVRVQWYPTDAGAFVSTSSDGNVLCWDTDRMEPVFRVRPDGACACADAQPMDAPLIATGSTRKNEITLVDLRSGAASHQLAGHDAGVTAVQWSPASPGILLASGSRDGSVRLWDIRKPGSRSCLATLHREAPISNEGNRYHADYAHMIKVPAKKRRKRKKGDELMPAPNNYNHIQSKGVRSHNGSVVNVSFFEDGHSLASVGSDGELLVWDLTATNGYMLPSRFVAPGGFFAGGSGPNRRRRPAPAPLMIDNQRDTIWIGHNTDLLEFTIEGGSPTQILKGHLHNVAAIHPVNKGLNMFTGSEDGMILTWGPDRSAKSKTSSSALQQDEDNW